MLAICRICVDHRKIVGVVPRNTDSAYYTRDRVMGSEPSVAARATAWSILRTNKGTDGYAVCVCEVGWFVTKEEAEAPTM